MKKDTLKTIRDILVGVLILVYSTLVFAIPLELLFGIGDSIQNEAKLSLAIVYLCLIFFSHAFLVVYLNKRISD